MLPRIRFQFSLSHSTRFQAEDALGNSTGAARLLLLAAGGGRHTLLVDARGAVHACGCGSSGQLGTGLAADEHKPVALAALGGQLVRDAAASGTGILRP